ncbi:hypothetical protein KJ713_03505 [Patescibacteria group bacterium]|nr:hypothetical protein [Patescibacteria group bacterium]
MTMEIRNYFRVIRRFIWWLIIPVFVFLIAALIGSLIYSQSYEGPVVFAINRKSQQKETLDYQYDSYYAIQANNVLASQFNEWLKGGSVVPAIYQRAGLKDESSILQKEWKVENHSPQDIEIIFRGRNKDRVSTLAQAALETVKDKQEEFTGPEEAALGTITIPSGVIITAKSTSLLLNLIVGFFAGILIGLIFVYFKEIFTTDEIQNPK